MPFRKKIKSLQISKSDKWVGSPEDVLEHDLKSCSTDTQECMHEKALENKARDLGVPVQELRDWEEDVSELI